MATLSFAAASTAHLKSAAGPAGLDGAFTVAVLYQRASTVSNDTLLSTNATGPSVGFAYFLGNKPQVYNDNAGASTDPSTSVPGPLSSDDTDLRIGVITRGSGETPRFHMKNITDVAAWAHGDGVNPAATNPDPASLAVYVGVFEFPGTGTFDYFDGDIGLVGWWNGIEMSDPQVEDLAANLQTSDWHTHTAGAPSSLTQLTSASPVDLEGLVTWTNNGATLTGGSMAAWDFDGTGPWPPVGSDDARQKLRVVQSNLRLA